MTVREVYERLYTPPIEANELIKIHSLLSDEELEKATPSIIKDHANPYTLTKQLAEHEVANSNLPAAIIRPSMSNLIVLNLTNLINLFFVCVATLNTYHS